MMEKIKFREINEMFQNILNLNQKKQGVKGYLKDLWAKQVNDDIEELFGEKQEWLKYLNNNEPTSRLR